MAVKIQLRNDTAAFWAFKNPVLALAEAGYEIDTGKMKIGDGSTAWNSLPYSSFGLTQWDGFTTTGGTSTYTRTALNGKTIELVKYGRYLLDPDEYSLTGSNFSFVGFTVEDDVKIKIAYS